MRLFVGVSALILVSVAGGASAHHSFAMFDSTRTVAIEGTVREFIWANPHATLWVSVKNAAGVTQHWPIEMTGPAALTRMGLNKRSFTAGERVKVDIRPLRNGNVGGALVGATKLDTGEVVRLNRGT